MPTNQKLKLGYLMNAYPMTSTTFIRREIEAMEELGADVSRYAIRQWGEALVDPKDTVEQGKTFYLLSGRMAGLAKDAISELFTNPKGLFRALGDWITLWRNGGGFVRHVAYFLEAVSLKRRAVAEDVAHIHAHFSTNTAAVALLSQKMGGPGYSFTTHGPDELVDVGPSSLKLKLQHARFGAAISYYCKTRLALAGGQEVWDKLHIVRCGVPVAEFVPNDAELEPDAPFVCVGRLCPQKAQVLICEAVAEVVKTHPQIKVVLIGDGEARADVEAAIATHGLERNIELLGWRENREVREIVSKARALLLPSFAEGLPVAIMEALALERPVISTYIAGIPELVDADVGWIIPAGSSAHIAQAMDAALSASPKTLASMGKKGRERVLDHHDVKTNAGDLLTHIRHAVLQSVDEP